MMRMTLKTCNSKLIHAVWQSSSQTIVKRQEQMDMSLWESFVTCYVVLGNSTESLPKSARRLMFSFFLRFEYELGKSSQEPRRKKFRLQ